MQLKKGHVSWMAIKIDLEKVYDRLSWQFIEDTLICSNFPGKLINITMDMISSTSLRGLWNGH